MIETDWTDSVGTAISYIEKHITEDISAAEIAKQVNISPFYFQKGFAMLCGYTVGEYVRKRRLSLAGSELVSSSAGVLETALKYGYDSPDSFTKAFTRFHGITPAAAKKEGAVIRSFAPLKIKIALEGGSIMDYKIMKKESFTVLGAAKIFSYEGAAEEIPKFWGETFPMGKAPKFCGMYGINIDIDGNEFEYLIAGNYDPAEEIPEGCVTRVIPSFTWAVFPCVGAMPDSIHKIYEKIYSEWLPENRDYEIAGGYCFEMYGEPSEFKNGTKDEKYYSEIWIPVKEK